MNIHKSKVKICKVYGKVILLMLSKTLRRLQNIISLSLIQYIETLSVMASEKSGKYILFLFIVICVLLMCVHYNLICVHYNFFLKYTFSLI